MLLGLLWGALLLVAVNLSVLLLTVVLISASAIAALSIARSSPGTSVSDELRRRLAVKARQGDTSWPAKPSRRTAVRAGSRGTPTAIGVAAAVICPLSGLAGPVPVFVVAGLAIACGAVLLARPPAGIAAALALSVAVCLPALGAGSVVASAHQGSNESFALVAALCAYDVGSFFMGDSRGALGGWSGIAGGVASVGVVAIAVAAALDPPFGGNRAWILFGIVACAAPLGVFLVDVLVGARRMPAVRRIDSFVLAAPAWVAAVPFVLHR